MYSRLTKVITQEDGKECVTCALYGTEKCHIHNGTPDCGHCEVLGAIFNQLNNFEEAFTEIVGEEE